ncbi:XdhC/CoxI family protein [Granulicella sp. dw_53]|uniref:XdhC family protein n=1 Tax=Granulicella sp. dw_53 TaxID=2719792 RepID=UPI001BD50C6D|nr:XdhC/CoxI family protein [Granulicella sp. dw_53]
MMERRQITNLARQGRLSALVTLVRVEGSSYRRPGARILATTDGEYAGTISGGCLEGELVRKAAWMVRSGAVIKQYSTLFDDTANMPYGLGCGGVVDLLIEPVDTPEFQAAIEAMEASLRGESSVMVSFLPDPTSSRGLRRLVLASDGHVVFASEGLKETKIECARTLAPGYEYEGRFVEELRPPQRLVVLGAGEDARPMVSMASSLGWNVVVADGRAQLARAERFPAASKVVWITGSSPELLVEQLRISSEDAVVLMTHSFEQDRELLTTLLPIAPRYLGVLGARHRSSLLVSEAAARIGLSVTECCARLYAPIGLDLGGDGPEAIALAVIAEAQACIQGKLGASRRLSATDVAEQIAIGSTNQYLHQQCALDEVATQ